MILPFIREDFFVILLAKLMIRWGEVERYSLENPLLCENRLLII